MSRTVPVDSYRNFKQKAQPLPSLSAKTTRLNASGRQTMRFRQHKPSQFCLKIVNALCFQPFHTFFKKYIFKL